MKKITAYMTWIGILMSVGIVWFAVALGISRGVIITATVGNVNHAPVVINVNPTAIPILVQRNTTQVITITVRDDEGDIVDYTVNTPAWDGTTIPTYWTITNSGALIAGTAAFSFTYVAPIVPPNPKTFNLTVTLNDGPNIVSKDISVKVF